MAQREVQRPSLHAAIGSGEPAGQSGARQRTAAQAPVQASASSLARFAVSTRAQARAAQQPLASFTGSGAYVVVAQSASLAQSAPAGGVGVGSDGVVVGSDGVVVGAGPGVALSFCDEQATASIRMSARMGRLWQ